MRRSDPTGRQRVKIRRDVSRIGFCYPERRHDGPRLDLLREAYPAHHAGRLVPKSAGQISTIADGAERGPDPADRPGHARNGMAAAAAVFRDGAPPPRRVTAGNGRWGWRCRP